MRNIRNWITKRLPVGLLALLFVIVTMGGPLAKNASAAVVNPTPQAKITFTFDDGLASTLTQAAPTLKTYGFSGTVYVSTKCIGMTTQPNTCQANTGTPYMSWAQVNQLKNTYGWEIASHTVSHAYLATSDPDEQPLPLTKDQVTKELVDSRAALAAQGIDAVDFAPPYGDYNMSVLAEIAKYYGTMRGFQDTGYNTWPYNDYLIRDQHVEGNTSVATVKGYIDNAIKNNQWLVLTFHDIKTRASTNPDDYEYSTANLAAIAAYVKSKNVPVVNVRDAMVKSDVNLLPNGSFNNGIADGWTTDSTSIIADANNNGSYPDPVKSVKLVGRSTNSHLFSPQVAVDANTTYLLKTFLNLQSRTSGGVSFYIDEYDSFGNWISGQYKTAENNVFVENINFSYKPTSTSVKKARLQIIVSGTSGITAYIDNAQWFPLSTTTPPVTPQNLLTNGTFDAGISGGWATNNVNAFKADAASHGSPANVVNSVSLSAQTSNTHLFSPLVTVTSTKSYSLAAYTNLTARTSSELGFYIDEYDINGNWISGQYKGGVTALGAADTAFNYTPTSASVAKASLQVILVGNSGIAGYIDDVRWY